MAVPSGSGHKEGKMKSPLKKKLAVATPDKAVPEKAKRNNNPGVRLVGARIYDSVNGKTCHQCRQKTLDYMAACKNTRNDKPCPIHFCHKCLLNRYGEKADDVSLLDDWNCPKCRGICNCSCCMKRRGCQPTGQLVHTAKATGYSSVSDMLHTKGIDNIDNIKVLKDTSASLKKIKTSNNEESIVSAEIRGKENCIEGAIALNMDPSHLSKHPNEKQSVGCKRKDVGCKRKDVNEKPDAKLSLKANSPLGKEKSKRIKKEGSSEVNNEANGPDLQNIPSLEDGPHGVEKKQKKSKKGLPESKVDSKQDVASVDEIHKTIKKSMQGPLKSEVDSTQDVASMGGNHITIPEKSQDPVKNDKKRSFEEGSAKDNANESNNLFALISLPQGTGLTTVGGIHLQSEDVGNALQFNEFCLVFAKVLDIKKGQPEAVLRDIMQGRSSRRGKCSLTIHFLTNLLSFLKEEDEERFSSTEGKTSWYDDLKICISESPSVSRAMGLDSLSKGADGFENLNPSGKLRTLNFICDEILKTVKIREWIDDENSKVVASAKEAKEKVQAAKDEEKRLKQKMQDSIAQAIIAKNGAPLSISEHEEIVSQIKFEAVEAHAAMMELKGTSSKYKNKRCEAVRSELFFLGTDGHAYWKLKCCSDKSVLLCQEIGTCDTAALDEKWSTFDAEEEKIIEKCVDNLRCNVKKVRAHRVPGIRPSQNTEATS